MQHLVAGPCSAKPPLQAATDLQTGALLGAAALLPQPGSTRGGRRKRRERPALAAVQPGRGEVVAWTLAWTSGRLACGWRVGHGQWPFTATEYVYTPMFQSQCGSRTATPTPAHAAPPAAPRRRGRRWPPLQPARRGSGCWTGMSTRRPAGATSGPPLTTSAGRRTGPPRATCGTCSACRSECEPAGAVLVTTRVVKSLAGGVHCMPSGCPLPI